MGKADSFVRFTRAPAAPPSVHADTREVTLSTQDESGPDPFELLDSFDAQIAATGRLLILTAERLFLLGGPEPLEQDPCRADFISRMPEGAVTAALKGVVSPLRALMPVARGTATRRRLRAVDDEGKTHLRGEVWTLQSESGATVGLTALKALRGYGKTLRRLTPPADPQSLAGAFEAAAHLRGVDPADIGKTRIEMTAENDAFDAAVGIIRGQLPVARRQEAGIIADIDSEFLHDYRVALRRVRSVVSLFKGVFSEDRTAELKTRFGALMARTGRLRDLDVYLLERDRYIALVPDSRRDGIARLFDRFAAERRAEQARLAAWLESPDYAREIDDLEQMFSAPGRLDRGPGAGHHALGYARALIWKRYRKVCKRAAGIADAPDAQVHALRIDCKKLRYLMEFFAPLFDAGEVKQLIKALKKLQDNLGAFNDYSVQQVSLEQAAGAVAGETGTEMVEIAAGIGALITVLNQRQGEERASVAASFAAFDSDETRAEFRKLFKPGKDAR